MYMLIVTGLSGAGKSNVLRALEDMGFYCVDNLPAKMTSQFIELCRKNVPPVSKAAIVIDSRESIFNGMGKTAILDTLNSENVRYEVLFLECSDEVLTRRYSETRRRHPMSPSIDEGMHIEREMLQPLKERAHYIIDTSDLKPIELKKRILALQIGEAMQRFRLVISSFGFKRGIPTDADMVFDVRFTRNPFYEKELRGLSGLDKQVQDYILRSDCVLPFLDSVEGTLRALIPHYIDNDKHRLMVAFGCTGGRHRSVFAAQSMYERLNKDWDAIIVHRDLVDEAHDIIGRFGKEG
ncbi:MAG: RNase adapter RapZ [Clostridia bacterium]|nr:RNase adapter RapZ [Clostridia bacterium]